MDYATEQITSNSYQNNRNRGGPPRQPNNNQNYSQNYQRGGQNQHFQARNNQQRGYGQPEWTQNGANRQYNPNYQPQGNTYQDNWNQKWNQPQPRQSGGFQQYPQDNNNRQNYNQNRGGQNRSRSPFNPPRQNSNINSRQNWSQNGPNNNNYNYSQNDQNEFQDFNQYDPPQQFYNNNSNFTNNNSNPYTPFDYDDSFGRVPGNRSQPQPQNRFDQNSNQNNYRRDYNRNRDGSQGRSPNQYSRDDRREGGNYNRFDNNQGRNRGYSPQNQRDGQRRGPEGGFQNYRQEPKRELTQQDLINLVLQKQWVDIQNHKVIKLPPGITQTNSHSPYIVPAEQSSQVAAVDLKLLESLQGPKQVKLQSTPRLINRFFHLPELQGMEQAQSVKGFKDSTGVSFNQFERMAQQLRAQILTNFDSNFRQ